jgi:hypothetical protein
MGKDTEGMSTLKEMNYRLQDMPNGCWNCRFDFPNGICCLALDEAFKDCHGRATRKEKKEYEARAKTTPNGRCDAHEKGAI